jgi:small subunit ribosomal protein S17
MAKSFTGIVTSDKPDKTIVVAIENRKNHPVYKKQYSVTKKFVAHDEKNDAAIGDTVRIVETKPISRRKHFALEEIVTRAPITHDEPAPGSEDAEEEKSA